MPTESLFIEDEYTRGLEIYLVGGAVRDQCMGIAIMDRDWVVVGSTPEAMRERGFRPVGKDFPVFLHPQTHEEYALARTERKTAPGYHGFTWHADETVTLEQDLERRDLTINAMAMNRDGALIDPFNGQADLGRNCLRHVSPAFREDPVRILRVARFAARFESQGFDVADPTREMMREMVEAGEVDALVAERVWQELSSALPYPGFYRFIEVLRESNALKVVLPEVDVLFGVPQRPEYHPEIDTGVHTLMALRAAARIGADADEMFAVLTHDLGKGLTPINELPSHRGHEGRGIDPINTLCDRLRVPNAARALALRVCEFHLHLHRLDELRPKTVLKLLHGLDAFRNPQNVGRFVRCCLADTRGRLGWEEKPYPQGARLLALFDAANAVDTAAVARQVTEHREDRSNLGASIAEAVRRARIKAIGGVTAD